MLVVRKLPCVLVAFFALLIAWDGLARGADPGYRLIKTIPVPGEGGWDYLTMDSAARRLYISRSDRVQVLDVDQGKVVGEIPKTPGVHGIALVPELDRGFTSNGRENTVTVFSLKTLEELDRIKVGTNPDGILYEPSSRRVFTFNGRSKDASAIDAATGKVVGTVKLEGRPESAVADERGQIYVNMEDKDEVVAFDAKELTVNHRWPIAPAKTPVGLSMDRANRRLFVSTGSPHMVVMDADTGKVLTTLPIGKGTDYCVFDPDKSLAFSSNGDSTMTIVHEESPNEFKVVQNVKTLPRARTCALDTKTHNILLCTAKFKPPPADAPKGKGGQRGTMEPGSFVVLVVGTGGPNRRPKVAEDKQQ